MAENSPPPSDAVPELTPDNGSRSSSSPNSSFDNQWGHQWGAQVADGEANEPYIPGQFDFLRDPEEVHDEDMPPSPPSSVTGIDDATQTPLLGRLARRVFQPVRSRGLVRRSSRSSPRAGPDRDLWNSSHAVAIPEFQNANHRPEEDERQDLSREEQGLQNPPVDSIPPLDLGSPVVSRLAPTLDVDPPRASTTRSLGTWVSATWRHLASTGRRLVIRQRRESGVPEGSDMPYSPAGDSSSPRSRGFWRGVWRGLRGGRGTGTGRSRAPRNGEPGRRRLFSSRRHTV